MPFRTFCNSEDAKCRKEVEPLLDSATDKVYCPECDLEITSVDAFMKRQLVSMGQVRKTKKNSTAFAITCKHCSKEKAPVIGKNKEILCGSCSKDITADLGAPFVQMLRLTLSRKQ